MKAGTFFLPRFLLDALCADQCLEQRTQSLVSTELIMMVN